MTVFKADNYFNLDDIDFKELFNTDNLFNVLGSRLKEYIKDNIKPEIKGIIEEGAYLADDMIFIGEGTVVESGAYIKGPTIIGKNCQIRQGAYIRGGVITGNNCVIGHATEVKNSIFLNGAKAAHFAYVGDSILGNRVNLGAGTKLANLKIDVSVVMVKDNLGNKHNSGLKKLGAILADDVEIGCNAVTSPGTFLGKNSRVYANTLVVGFIPENSIVKNKAKVEIVKMV
jgi:NDP-sugar pyrophosphorylase family protein